MSSENALDLLNGLVMGFDQLLGLRYLSAQEDELVAEIPVTAQLQQPYGLVHGGVYASIAESMASSGAALTAIPRDQSVVGLENSTSFIRAVRAGTLKAVAKPLTRGRRSQVWEVRIYGDDGRLAAIGRVRMLCLDKGAVIAGEPPRVRAPGRSNDA